MNMSKGCFAAIVVICLIFFALVSVPIGNADWTMDRSGPSRIGVATGSQVLTPNVLWKTNVSLPSVKVDKQSFEGGRTFTTPVVLHGIIYACSTSSVGISEYNNPSWLDVYAFNATDGTEIWDHKINNMTDISVPAVTDNVVYFRADNGYNVGYVYALNVKNGNLQWRTNVNGIGLSSPAINDGILYVGGGNDFFYALNAANGETIWKHTTDANIAWGSPAVVNGVVYVGADDGNLYAFNAKNGDLLWKYNVGVDRWPSVAVDNGVAYTSSNAGTVCAVNETNGNLIWEYDTTPPEYISQEQNGVQGLPFPVACDNGVVYVTCEFIIPTLDRGWPLVYALNATTGSKIWNLTINISSNDMSAPVIADGVLYMNTFYGIIALNTQNATAEWNYNATINYPWSSDLIVDNGAIFVGSSDGQVYALGSAPPTYPPYSPTLPPFQAASTTITIALSIFVICTITVIILARLRKSKPKVNLLVANP